MRRLFVALLFAILSAGCAQAGTTWNPSDCNIGITLSGGNLVATRTGATWVSCRSIESRNFDHNYIFRVDVTDDGAPFSHGILIGIGDASASLATYIGADAHGCTIQMNNQGVYGCINQSSLFTPYGSNNGRLIVYIAVNTTGNLSISTDACSTWYNLNTGGVGNITSTASPVFITVSEEIESVATFEQVTLDTTAAGCAFPPGYGAWSPVRGGLLLQDVGQ